MINRKTLGILVICTSFLTTPQISSANDEGSPRNITKSWFEPYLTLDQDPDICKLFLDDAIQHHYSNESEEFIFNPYRYPNYRGKNFTKIPLEQHYELGTEGFIADGRKFTYKDQEYYIINSTGHFATVYYYAYGFVFKKEDFEKQAIEFRTHHDLRERKDLPEVPTIKRKLNSPATAYDLLQKNDRIFAVSEASGFYALYEFNGKAKWAETCIIKYKQDNFETIANENLSNFHKVSNTLKNIMGSAGSCGSLKSHGRRKFHMIENLNQLLVRPWPMPSTPSYIDSPHYISALDFLKIWGHRGFWNYQHYKELLNIMPLALNELSQFYAKQFAMTSGDAKKLAPEAFDYTLRNSFYLNKIYSYENSALHQAILEEQTLDVIDDLLVDVTSDKPENLLTYSINSPEITEFLLKKGVDPNGVNEFGKTPLMYAAQFNQYETARLLLEYGAEPNATTFKPSDRCGYTLKTINVTALHYAVRNASKDLIKLLLKFGASTNIKTKETYNGNIGYPVEWLVDYTLDAKDERNPNISDQEAVELQALLAVTSN